MAVAASGAPSILLDSTSMQTTIRQRRKDHRRWTIGFVACMIITIMHDDDVLRRLFL
jgi:hypothetical protein